MTEVRYAAGLVRERVGGIVTLRIEREDKLGALSSALLDALDEEITTIRSDSSVAAVVLTGTGRAFVAGADIAEYRDSSGEQFASYQHRSRALFDSIAALPQPVIAAVNGYALGGGFELALACDFILAADGARFGLPEVRLGLVPGGGGPQRLARRSSASWAKEVTMTGRMVDAQEALSRGVVSRVVPGPDVLDEALALANDIAVLPWQAVRTAKRLVDDGAELPLADALGNDQQALLELYETYDGQEGIASFLERRAPRFAPQGRTDITGAQE